MNRMGFGFSAFVAAALLASAAQAGPGFIIAPVSATVDTNGPGFGSITNTFDQSGLSAGYTAGVTNFDDYIASAPSHTTTFNGFEFFANSGTNSLQVTYDFGAATVINALALWNEEASGIASLNLLTSNDGINFTSLVSGLSPTNNTVDYFADVFAFGAVSARYVRFSASGCPQSGIGAFPGCAIGEVAFRTGTLAAPGVPEPASWAMMIAGFGLVGAAMRRRVAVAA